MSEPLRFLVEITGRRKGRVTAEDTTFYFTDRPFCTSGTDINPDQYYYVRVDQPSQVSRHIFRPGSTRGKSDTSRSSIVLHNADRAFDLLLQYDLRRATVRCGLASATTLADHPVQTSGRIAMSPRFTKPSIDIAITDARQLLALPFQQNVYGGTNVAPNGIDGDASIAGQVKPWCHGVIKQMPGVLVNGPKLIYQFNDGVINHWDALYDKGVPLTYGGAYYAQSDLEDDAQEPDAGEYKVWMEGGCCRLGSLPLGPVTADFKVGATAGDRTRAEGMERVWRKVGYEIYEWAAEDLAAMQDFDPEEITLCVRDNRSAEAVCDELAAPIAWWGASCCGVLRFAPLTLITETPVVTFTQHSLLKDQITLEPANDAERGRPLKKLTFKYAQIQQTQTDPAAGVSAERQQYLKLEHRSVAVEDATVGATFENAGTLTLVTPYAYEAGARRMLAREFALRKVERFRFTFTAYYTREHAWIDLGDTIGLDYPGFGLKLFGDTLGRAFTVIGVEPNAKARSIQFTVWGNSLLARNIAARASGALLRARDGKFLLSRAA